MLASAGPGPMAFTRMRGASACAIVFVAVKSADLLAVGEKQWIGAKHALIEDVYDVSFLVSGSCAAKA